MKKLFTFLSALAFASSVFAQSLVMDQDTMHCSGDAVEGFSCNNNVKNNSSSNGNFKWVRFESIPEGWHTSVCDKNNCYGTATSMAPIPFSLNAGQSGLINVNFNPNGITGSGMVRLVISSSDNLGFSKDSYYFGAADATGVTTVSQEVKDILLYPTPVRENVYVVFNPTIKPERVDVYNLLGQKVKTFPVQLEHNNYRVELQLGDLDKGLYFVRVYQDGSNQVITRQFTKE